MKIDTEIRHVTKPGANIFLELGFPPAEAKRLHAASRKQINDTRRRHSKQYRNLYKMQEAMQAERIAGFRDFIEDVRSEGFPGPEHSIEAPDGLISAFVDHAEKNNT